MTVKQMRGLFSALRSLYLFSPVNVIISLSLMLLQGVTSGIGILLLLPLLSLIGLQDTSLLNNQLMSSLERLFVFFEIELNLISILLLYVAILSAVAMIQYLLSIKICMIQQRIICFYREQLNWALLKSSWQFLSSKKMPDFTHALTTQIQSMGNAFQLLLLLITQLIMISVYVLLALALSWKISFLALIFATVLFFLITPLTQKIYLAGGKRLLGFRDIFGMISEQLESIKMIKSFGVEDRTNMRLKKASDQLERQIVIANTARSQSKLIYTIGSVVFVSFVFYASVVWLETTISTLLLLILIFSRLLPNAALATNTLHQLLFELPSIEDVNYSIQLSKDNAELASTDKVQQTTQSIICNSTIEFRNVYYQYPDRTHAIVENLSFKIEVNKTTAFFGPSGSGKTTVADLLMGLLVPSGGKITCGKIELQTTHMLSWRKQIAYVTQEFHLFHQSIRDNLSCVGVEVTDKEIWEALEQAAAKDFVERLPDGLDSLIGDKGAKVSGGERQRLALARALLVKPRLLILDEATSALDYDNEQRIKEALENLKGKLTIVIIAHRQSSIEHADHVVHFNAHPGET